MRSVTIEAFAKINLTLRVAGLRGDGFHDVRTLLQTIDLSDRLVYVSRRGPLRLRCRAAGFPRSHGARAAAVPDDHTNLIWQATTALWRAAGRPGEPRDLEIEVTKRIPVRAGLGGGSSDAAATLMALARLWNLALPRHALAPVAATLGSDVPFFLCGGAALGLGRGDEIYPLADLPRWWAVIVAPPFGVSTAEAYRWHETDLDRERAGSPHASPDPRLARTWLGGLPALGNDLEAPVARRHPEIARTVAALRRQGAAHAAMSGSGSAIFGLFASSRAAHAACRRLRVAAGWRAQVVRLLSREEFIRLTRPVLAVRRNSRIN
jgi:4-diphosphocytidyl-2-C-methyl-D-erythritol kinase